MPHSAAVLARHTPQREDMLRTLQDHALSCIERISGAAVAAAVRVEGLRYLHRHVPLDDIARITEAFYTSRPCESDMWRMMATVAKDEMGMDGGFYLLREVFLRIVPPFSTYRDRPGYHVRRRDVDALKYKFGSHAPHRDSWAGDSVNLLNVWMAIDEVPAAAGITVFPGFEDIELPHLSTTPFYATHEANLPVVPQTFDMRPGDCVLFGADELHGTRLNTTDVTRVAVSGRIALDTPRYWPQFASTNRDQWLRASELDRPEPDFIESHETVAAPPTDSEGSHHTRLPRPVRAASYHDWTDACAQSEIAGGQGFSIRIGEKEIALFRRGSDIIALDNVCPHLYYRLANGPQRDGRVTCPGHCLSFDLETGACTDDPSFAVRRHQTRVEGDRVFVKLA